MIDFLCLDDTLRKWWEKHDLTPESFYCKTCGKCLVDIDFIQHTVIKFNIHNRPYINAYGKNVVEPESMRWMICGKELAGKYRFRHLCWECFFKNLRETVDIARYSRKSTWYKKILNGENPIPQAHTSSEALMVRLFDMTADEIKSAKSKYDTASKAAFIRHHGEVEGLKLYDEYRKRQSYTASKDYFINERGMTEAQVKELNRSRASTKENFIARYGEKLGTEKWNKYCAHEAYAGNSLTWFIDKYGKEVGHYKYEEMCRKKFTVKWYSEMSQQLFSIIDEKLGNIAYSSRWELKNHEKELFIELDGLKKLIKVDYCLGNKIIEFNGDYWHANPQYYSETDTQSRFEKTIVKVTDIWLHDTKRLDAIKSLGYEVLVVWESEYCKQLDETVKKCCEFLASGT